MNASGAARVRTQAVHMMQMVLGLPDFEGESPSIIGTTYYVRICDGKPIGKMSDKWARVRCAKCLKLRPRRKRG